MYAQMAEIAELPPPIGTRFSPVRLVPETGSTNADLLAAARTGAAEGAVLLTDHQRAGRGRQRRVWYDRPGGSLLVSVLLRPQRDLAPLIPLVTGLAAVDAVRAVAKVGAGSPIVGLKWPNDVLAPAHGERKLAGILAEAEAEAGRLPGGSSEAMVVVVGMGMNLRLPDPPGAGPDEPTPDDVASRAVTLAEVVGHAVDRDTVLDRFLVGLERWLTRMEEGEPVLDAYRSVCLTIGRSVRFTTSQGEHHGRAVDISPAGTLLLDTGHGPPIELNAGDAHHL